MAQPSSGDSREDQAAAAGAAIAVIFAAVEAAILAAVADLTRRAVLGLLLPAVAARRLARQIAAIFAEAQPEIRAVLRDCTQAASASAAEVIRADLRGLPRELVDRIAREVTGYRLPPMPDLQASLEAASRTASRVAQEVFMRAVTAGPDRPSVPESLLRAGLNPFRTQEDEYQRAVREAIRFRSGIGEAVRDLTGAERRAQSLSRLQTAQKVIDDLAARGITGFTDARGRNWELASYAEMATRTASSRLHLQLQLAAMGPAGMDLVIVDNPGRVAPCPRCRGWEGRVLSLTGRTDGDSTITDAGGQKRTEKIAGTLAEATTAGLLHPSCFPGDVMVTVPSGVRAADSRWYEGELVVIHTAGGDELPVTPNHPVLTPEGWVAAGSLKVGQRLVRHGLRAERMMNVRPSDEQIPARIGEVFDALRHAGAVTAMRVPASAEQFHGDGRGADVDVVLADRLLEYDGNAHRFTDSALLGGHSPLGPLVGAGAGLKRSAGHAGTSGSRIGGSRKGGTLCGFHAREAAAHGLAATYLAADLDDAAAETGLRNTQVGRDDALVLAGLIPTDGLADLVGSQAALANDAGRRNLPHDGGRADAEDVTDLLDRLSGLVTLDHIISLGSRQVATHVYNLQSGDGWYVANGIVVHNCRHSLLPWTNGAAFLPTVGGQERGYVEHGQPVSSPLPIGTLQDYKDEQKLRGYERSIRAARRGRLAAMTPQAKRDARRDVDHAVSVLERHVSATNVLRQKRREKLGPR